MSVSVYVSICVCEKGEKGKGTEPQAIYSSYLLTLIQYGVFIGTIKNGNVSFPLTTTIKKANRIKNIKKERSLQQSQF